MNQYIGVLALLLVVAGFLLFMLLLASILGPKSRSDVKDAPFECGTASSGNVKQSRFGVHFYVIALLFILFDIEVVFLYPWGVALRELGWAAFYEMLVFLAVLAVSLLSDAVDGFLNLLIA